MRASAAPSAGYLVISFWHTGRDTFFESLGRVAEWQTRWLQVPVSERMWGFKSPFAHKQ